MEQRSYRGKVGKSGPRGPDVTLTYIYDNNLPGQGQ